MVSKSKEIDCDKAIALAFSRLKLPVMYMDIWSMNDLFEYLEIYSEQERKAKTGESKEVISTADEMEVF